MAMWTGMFPAHAAEVFFGEVPLGKESDFTHSLPVRNPGSKPVVVSVKLPPHFFLRGNSSTSFPLGVGESAVLKVGFRAPTEQEWVRIGFDGEVMIEMSGPNGTSEERGDYLSPNISYPALNLRSFG